MIAPAKRVSNSHRLLEQDTCHVEPAELRIEGKRAL
jgi:hypothetical protein